MKIKYIFISLLSIIILPCQGQQKDPDILSQILQTQNLLSKVSSYHSTGKITITYSAKTIAMATMKNSTDKTITKAKPTKTFTYEVFSKDGNMKLILNEIDSNGLQIDHTVHYLTPTSYTRFNNDFAIVTSNTTGVDQAEMNDFFGPFLPFSFLLQPVTIYGFRPLTPSVLRDKNAWMSILDPSKIVIKTNEKGESLLSYQEGVNRWEILFSKTPIGNLLMPQEIKFYTKVKNNEFLARHIIVNSYREDTTIKVLPQKMTLECYLPMQEGGPAELLGTCDFTVEKTEINPQIDDDIFAFDPATASRLWDDDKRVFINIPK
ncbi:MAG TPA: hypothetical protein VNX68_17210 [Nitrosopumilaceae archaeon]|jgi:hypothetical protein|nr:hypothetical protein [Nitrosopumilaceae archaeon]